ncbi:MAG TPA: hypothetical protein VMQ83_00525 [Gammaproteobacteria bacterium]|nr:hypothetical protein [Gammaproteobacteria bacterium]
MRLLDELQGMLQQTYDLAGEHRVSDFLTGNPALVEALGIMPGTAGAGEQVLVSQQDADCVDLAVYIAPEVLERLGESDPLEALHDSNLADFLMALEGVSHFVYLAWNAGLDKPVTRLELELQGEVDKFVLTALVLATRQGRAPDALHHGLFRRCRLEPSLDDESRARYQAASRYAETYCRGLLERFRRKRDMSTLWPELRRFYRLTQRGKMARIDYACA